MPNWCETEYFITGDKQARLRLYMDLMAATSRYAAFKDESDFGTEWFGNLLLQLGYDKDDFASITPDMHVRGSIHDFGLRQDCHGTPGIWMACSLAWEPNPLTVQNLINKHYPGLDFVMLASEPGCGLYINTDKKGDFFGTRWVTEYLEHDGGCPEWQEYESTREAADALAEVVGMTEEDLYKALDRGSPGDLDTIEQTFNKKNPGEETYFTINRYEDDLGY